MAEEREAVWKMGRGRFQALEGVHRPHVMEISTVQYGRMSKSARKAYDAKRSAEWDASAECAAKYARLCFEAYEADPEILKSPDLHPEAKSAIWAEKLRRKKAEVEERLKALREQNQIQSADELEVGDRVYWLLAGRYVRVVKKAKASFRGVDDDGHETKVAVRACHWLHYNELKEAAEQGRTTIRPERGGT